jgi:CHAT domain-containing protein/tetratricopeptide (TPR) repeat protein
VLCIGTATFRRGLLATARLTGSALLVVVFCVSGGVRVFPQPSNDFDHVRQNVRRLLDEGAYDKAEREARESSKLIEARFGLDSSEFESISDLLVESLYRNGKAASPETIELAERTLVEKERRLGPDHLDLSPSLHNVGAIREERGEFRLALPFHERALEIRVKVLGLNDPAVADSLEQVAFTLVRLERLNDAHQLLDQARAVREAGSQVAPLGLARTLELLGLMHRYAGAYALAASLLDDALAIRHQLLPDHPATAWTLLIRGDVYWLQGDLRSARRTYQEALALGEGTMGPQHPAVALYRRKVALMEWTFGNLAEARRMRESALHVGEAVLAECHLERLGLLSDLASSILEDGEYAQARGLYVRALATAERCLGSAHSLTATIIYNLADLERRTGDVAEAERLEEQVVRTWSASLGPNHPYVARALDTLAEIVESRGQIERARSLYDRALKIRQAVDPAHPDVAWTLINLARVTAASGDLNMALELIRQANDIFERAGASDEPDHFGKALALRGEIQANQGDFELARVSLLEALSLRERIFGKTHPLTAAARAQVAAADFALAARDSALSRALEAERDGRDHLRFTLRYLPERQAVAYASQRPRGLDLALSLLAIDRAARPDAVLNSVVESRSVILDELAARARSAVGADPQLASLNVAVASTRQRFANLMFRSVGGGEAVSPLVIDEARREKEEAERTLAERSATMRNELARADVGLVDVRRALSPRRSLVSFVRYERTSVTPAKNGKLMRRVAPSYMAFVVRGDDATLAVVPIGSAATLDWLVAQWRAETTGAIRAPSPDEAIKSYRAAGSALRQRVWDPLRPYLNDVETVFIVPDGTLNLVSFAALPVGQSSYLIDRGPIIHYLAAERDLVNETTSSSSGRGLLALGGAAFSDATLFARTSKPASPAAAKASPDAVLASVRSSSSDTLRAGCGSLQTMQFTPLAGTSREVRAVAALWTESPAQVLEGRDASEPAFKREAPGHRVLHLATHGFFLGNDCAPAGAATRSVGALTTGQTKTANRPSQPKRSSSALSENPLLMSGLALAGANRRSAAGPNEDDGVLTAEEVSALNLEGVEWAVLSACDTGLGEVKAGEGVFGLRRAFQVAGVRTVIMSLWPIDDQATRVWMRALYQGRLQKRLSTAEAMHNASLSVLRERRARHQSTHPFYWAAFVAAGDWR